MNYITSEELGKMFRMQEELNRAYKGKDWHEQWTIGQIKAATYAELAEFLNERPSDWKTWISCVHDNNVKAIFEFIDVVHFMLMALLREYSEEILIHASVVGKNAERRKTDDIYADLFHHYEAFMSLLESETNFFEKMTNLRMFFVTGAEILSLKEGEFFKAYEIKNRVNMQRATGGSSHDRSTEILTLES